MADAPVQVNPEVDAFKAIAGGSYSSTSAAAAAPAQTPPANQPGEGGELDAFNKIASSGYSTEPAKLTDDQMLGMDTSNSGLSEDERKLAGQNVGEPTAAQKAQREKDHPVVSGIDKGLTELASPVLHPVDTVKNMALHTGLLGAAKDFTDRYKESIPILNAYENARSKGGSLFDSLKAANAEAGRQEQAHNTVMQAIEEYKKNPKMETAKALTKVVGTAGLILAGGAVGSEGATASESAEGAETATEGAETTTPAAASTKTPIETVAEKNAGKSGLSEGTPGTPKTKFNPKEPISSTNPGASDEFEGATPNARAAMKDLLQDSTGQGKVQTAKQAVGMKPSTNYLDAFRKLNSMSSEELTSKFGAEAPAARAFVAKQARNQLVRKLALGGGIALAAKEFGVNSYILHALID